MLQDWESAAIGNTAGAVSRLPRAAAPARVVINLVRGRPARPARAAAEMPSAA